MLDCVPLAESVPMFHSNNPHHLGQSGEIKLRYNFGHVSLRHFIGPHPGVNSVCLEVHKQASHAIVNFSIICSKSQSHFLSLRTWCLEVGLLK